eukprot:COSAG01_NODE_392_length_17668_cov_5.382264_19_plen_168_part_00
MVSVCFYRVRGPLTEIYPSLFVLVKKLRMETPGGADEPGTNIRNVSNFLLCAMFACISVPTTKRASLHTMPGLPQATFNGNRVDIGDSWRAEVPTVGVFACEYVTKQHQASLFLRLGLARRLLMPGSGRWAAIPEELRVPGEHIEEADTERSEYHIRHIVVMIGTLD